MLQAAIFLIGGLMGIGNAQTQPVAGLPHEAGSPSEVLGASHLFSVEVITLEETPWAKGTDGLEHRALNMEMRLLDVQKGTVALAPQKTFRLRVEQRREDEFLQLSFQGLWSHATPAVGTRYLVFSEGASTDPAELMNEKLCKRLLDSGYAADVRLATQGERIFRQAQGGGAQNAAKGLLDFAQQNRAKARDVFGRFMWARVGPAFNETEGRSLPEMLQILRAPDTTRELRSALAAELYAGVLLFEPTNDAYRKLTAAFLEMLGQKENGITHGQLAEVYVYGLVFDAEDQPLLTTKDVPAAARASALATVSKLSSDRGKRLAAWLRG